MVLEEQTEVFIDGKGREGEIVDNPFEFQVVIEIVDKPMWIFGSCIPFQFPESADAADFGA